MKDQIATQTPERELVLEIFTLADLDGQQLDQIAQWVSAGSVAGRACYPTICSTAEATPSVFPFCSSRSRMLAGSQNAKERGVQASWLLL